ncbi:transport protein Sec24-like protein, partial [Tanacetum coccineum]
IQAAFSTHEIRRIPPTPQDEMRVGMSYFYETMWKGVSKFLRLLRTLGSMNVFPTICLLFSSLHGWVVIVMIIVEGRGFNLIPSVFVIHFYNLKRALHQLDECREHLDLLLESIPTMFQNNKTAESDFGAGIKAGSSISVLPSVGISALSAREAEGRTNISAGEKEPHKLLQPAVKTLKTMAIKFAEYQVSVDVFITTQSYVDIASISISPRTTRERTCINHGPFEVGIRWAYQDRKDLLRAVINGPEGDSFS